MTSISDPLDPNCIDGFMTTRDDGAGPVGTISNLEWEEVDGVLHFTFETVMDDDIENANAAILIIRNGIYQDRIPYTQTNWSYTPRTGSTIEEFKFYLCPNDVEWKDYIDSVRITNSVRLWWNYVDASWSVNDAKKIIIKHCYGSGTPATTLATLTRIGATTKYQRSSGTNRGRLYQAGKWEDPDSHYAVIHVAITKVGGTGIAEYTWTYGDWTGTGVCQEWYDHIVNGIKIHFSPVDNYELDDEWDIVVSLPNEWTSGSLLIGGTSTFGVNSINSAGDVSTGPTAELTLYIPPDAPTITGVPIYADGSGEIEITWDTPSLVPSPLVSYQVYRNWPHTGIDLVDWAWEYAGAATAGNTFTVTITGLESGVNRICATIVDELGNESDFSIPWEINLNPSLNEYGTDPNMPDSISARMLTTGNIEVTVVADSTSDEIHIYHDSTTGTIDYTTVAAVINNPRAGVFQHLKTELSDGLVDGIYRIAARASQASSEEKNTDLWCSVLRDKDPAEIVTGLVATVVYA